MCGITGSYQQADGRKLVDIMADRIAHRGPDASGIWSHEDDRVSIGYRPKASFSAPLRAWVRNDLREVINDVLVRGELVGSGMIRAGALDRLIHDERAGREDNAKQIRQLLTMELWYRNVRSMGVAA